ncbi:MAG: DUF4405 domain-containing protein [Candidatus Electrothrix communis]|nr:MAG: DUF4405 domain-containing protein [Candidatus Electrothrix communis]
MRKTTSLLLLLSGFIELITSIFLYIAPMGRIAYWHDYRLLWMNRAQWRDIHITMGTLFLLVAFLHIYLNWRPILAYLKNKSKQLTIFNKNFTIALLVTLYFMIGTLYSLPPMGQIIQLGKDMTVQANNKYSEPPFHHAERATLQKFCAKMKISQDATVALFKGAGIAVDGLDKTMTQIAKKNNRSPQQLYEILQPIIPPRKEGEHH